MYFIASTTGQGAYPGNMSNFMNDLTSNLDDQLFKDLKFSVFGLGDNSYAYYNKAA